MTPALSLHQPWASLCVTRQPRDNAARNLSNVGRTHTVINVPEPMVKWIETRTWPCPPKYIGQRLAIASTKVGPNPMTIGDYWMSGGLGDYPRRLFRRGESVGIVLPLGCIIGSVTVTDCLPIVSDDEILPDSYDLPDAMFVCPSGRHTCRLFRDSDFTVDLADQLPYGDFAPGRWAWIFTDAAPTVERCPWCGRSPSCAASRNPNGGLIGDDCPFAAYHGGPIPARGGQRIWPWRPT